MQGGAPHAEKYPQLDQVSTQDIQSSKVIQVAMEGLLTLQLAHPIASTISIAPSIHTAARYDVSPGFLAWQSAHVLFPATDLVRSCRARSLRACCLLLNVPDMAERL